MSVKTEAEEKLIQASFGIAKDLSNDDGELDDETLVGFFEALGEVKEERGNEDDEDDEDDEDGEEGEEDGESDYVA